MEDVFGSWLWLKNSWGDKVSVHDQSGTSVHQEKGMAWTQGTEQLLWWSSLMWQSVYGGSSASLVPGLGVRTKYDMNKREKVLSFHSLLVWLFFVLLPPSHTPNGKDYLCFNSRPKWMNHCSSSGILRYEWNSSEIDVCFFSYLFYFFPPLLCSRLQKKWDDHFAACFQAAGLFLVGWSRLLHLVI